MKKLLLIIALCASSAFAGQEVLQTQNSTVTTGSSANSVSQGGTGVGGTGNGGAGGAGGTGIANGGTICVGQCAAQDTGSRDLTDLQIAAINAQAARDIAATTQTIKNTPSVSGPNLTTSNDTCMGSTSGSLNIAGLGFGGGTSWVDDNCKMLKNSRELWNMGMKAASLALMCTDKANKEALEITGFICPQTAAARKAEDDAKATELKLKSTDTLSLAK